MVGSTLGVYSFGLIFVSARTNKRHHHHWSGDLAVVLWRSRERVDLDQRSLLKTVGLPWNRLQRVAGGAEQVQGRQCSRERCLEVFRPVQRAQQAVAGSGSTRCVAHARASGQTLYNTACGCPSVHLDLDLEGHLRLIKIPGPKVWACLKSNKGVCR